MSVLAVYRSPSQLYILLPYIRNNLLESDTFVVLLRIEGFPRLFLLLLFFVRGLGCQQLILKFRYA